MALAAAVAALAAAASASAEEPSPSPVDFRIETVELAPVGYAFTPTGRLLIAGNRPSPSLWSVAPDGSVEQLESPLTPADPIRLAAQHGGEVWLFTEGSVLHHRTAEGAWSAFPLTQPAPLPPGCADCRVSRSFPMTLVALGPGRAALATRLLVVPGARRYFTEVAVAQVEGGRLSRGLVEGMSELAQTSRSRTLLVTDPPKGSTTWTVRTVDAEGVGPAREVLSLGGVDYVADEAGNLWFHNARGLHLLPPEGAAPVVVGGRSARVLATGPALPHGAWALLLESDTEVRAAHFTHEALAEGVSHPVPAGGRAQYGTWAVAQWRGVGLVVLRERALLRQQADGAWTRYALSPRLDAEQARAQDAATQTRLRRFAPWLNRLHPGGVAWLQLCLALGALIASPRLKGAVRGRWPQAILGAGGGATLGLLLAPWVQLGSGWYQPSSSMGIDLNETWWTLARLAMAGGFATVGFRLSLAPHRRRMGRYLLYVLVLVGPVLWLKPLHVLWMGAALLASGFAVRLWPPRPSPTSRRTPPSAGRSRA